MDIETYKMYVKNFHFLNDLLKQGHDLVLMPVINSTMKDEHGNPAQQVALCTQKDEEVFPHAVMCWSDPLTMLKPDKLEGASPDANPNPDPTD